jgi:hypothetical protein
MNIPRHIKRAIRSWMAWRRRKQFMRELGVEDTITKFAAARRQHKPTKALQRKIAAACRAQLEREVRHG